MGSRESLINIDMHSIYFSNIIVNILFTLIAFKYIEYDYNLLSIITIFLIIVILPALPYAIFNIDKLKLITSKKNFFLSSFILCLLISLSILLAVYVNILISALFFLFIPIINILIFKVITKTQL